MNLREIATSRLKEYENNPRNNDLAVEKVKYSIERFGFLFPVVIDVNYVIVAGHTRVRACKELGIQSIPCIIADDLTEEQINFFRLVDNKTSEYSDWDFEKLKEELEVIDLTLEENQLLLERFELSTEVFDIEPEQAEIKITAFNFMGVKESKPKEKKPTVSTIKSEESTQPEEINSVTAPENEANEVRNDVVENNSIKAEDAPEVASSTVSGNIPQATEEPKQPKAVLQFNQFRFGDVSFFISQVELDKLNEKYAEYINSGEILKGSFVNYLLNGVERND